MSHVHPPHHVHHLGFSRKSLMWLVAVLVVAAAIAVTLILAIGNDDTSTSSTSSPTPVTQSGPNESLRGQSAAGAVGAGSGVVQSQQTGPNETLRGQAAGQ
jgi:hypothetical protein